MYLDEIGLAHFWAKIKAYLTANYLPLSSYQDYFDIDNNGNIEPTENPTTSLLYELDGNGDIVPKEAA